MNYNCLLAIFIEVASSQDLEWRGFYLIMEHDLKAVGDHSEEWRTISGWLA